jgi:hypothetical protein
MMLMASATSMWSRVLSVSALLVALLEGKRRRGLTSLDLLDLLGLQRRCTSLARCQVWSDHLETTTSAHPAIPEVQSIDEHENKDSRHLPAS